MKISIGADHRGLPIKEALIQQFSQHEWLDRGTHGATKVDYPLFAQAVCNDILQGNVDVGVLICGSGVGMSIAANRYKKIYAALCWSSEVAVVAKQDDNANVLVLPADFITTDQAVIMFQAWIEAEFKGGLYAGRLDLVDQG